MARWWNRAGTEHEPAPARAVAPPVQRAAWRDLPPTPPAISAIQPIAPLDPFVGSLATSYNPSFLGTLGHLVDPAGPSGQVEGLARVGNPATVSTGPELVVAARPSGAVSRAVQRIAAAAPRILFQNDSSPTQQRPAPTAPEPVADSSHEVAVPLPAPPALGENHQTLRTLPAVQRVSQQPNLTGAPVSDLPVVRGVSRLDHSSTAPFGQQPDATAAGEIALDDVVPTQQSAAEPWASPEQGRDHDVGPAAQPRSEMHAEPAEPITHQPSQPTALDDGALPDRGLPESATAPTLGAGQLPSLPVSRTVDSGNETSPQATAPMPAVTQSQYQRVRQPERDAAPATRPPVGLGAPLTQLPATAAPSAGAATVQRLRQTADTVPPIGIPHATSAPDSALAVSPVKAPAIPIVSRSVGDPTPSVSSRTDIAPHDDPAPDAPTAPLVGLNHLMRLAETAVSNAEPTPPFVPPSSVQAPTRTLGLGAPMNGPLTQRTVESEPAASVGQRVTSPVAAHVQPVPTPETAAAQVQPVMTPETADQTAPSRTPAQERLHIRRTDTPADLQLTDVTGAGTVPADDSPMAAPLIGVNDLIAAPSESTALPSPSRGPQVQRTLQPAVAPPRDRNPNLIGVQRFEHSDGSASATLTPQHDAAPSGAAAEHQLLTEHLTAPPTSPWPPAQQGPEAPPDSAPATAAASTTLQLAPLLAQQPLQRVDVGQARPPAIAHHPPEPPGVTTVQRSREQDQAGSRPPQRLSPAPGQDFHTTHTVRSMSLQRMFEPGSTAVANGIAHHDSAGSVVFDPPATSAAAAFTAPEASASSPPTLIQRTLDTGSTAGDVAVSRAPTSDPMPAGQPPVQATGTPLPTDLDELARRLFDPLSARLKAELSLDRERAGLAIDLRR